jgi:hypothetical protein
VKKKTGRKTKTEELQAKIKHLMVLRSADKRKRERQQIEIRTKNEALAAILATTQSSLNRRTLTKNQQINLLESLSALAREGLAQHEERYRHETTTPSATISISADREEIQRAQSFCRSLYKKSLEEYTKSTIEVWALAERRKET